MQYSKQYSVSWYNVHDICNITLHMQYSMLTYYIVIMIQATVKVHTYDIDV